MTDYEGNQIEGWMGLDELRWLYDRALTMEKIVEIGSWMGKSTHALLSTGKPIVAIDHFKGSASQIADVHKYATMNDLYAAFHMNVGHFPNLLVMKMDSYVAAEFFKEKSVDMIFIDGDHEYSMIKRDLEVWYPKCKKLMCGHDRGENGVPAALAEFGMKIKEEVGSIWSIAI